MSPRYDVFLSHATADKPAVEYLAHKLREAGIEPFLDKWHLIPGAPWQEALEEALDESRTCAVFLGPKGIGGWQNEEMRSALEGRVSNKTFRVIPVLLPDSFEPRKGELPRFLRRLTWVDFQAGLDDEEAFRRLVSGIRGTAPGPDGGGGGGGPIKLPRPYPYRSMAQAPEEFVHRGEYDKVLEVLCPKEGTVQSGMSVGITTALRGAGGFGKTALAQQLCQDERVRETYSDGILWTTMGEDIDSNGRLSRIRDLIRWWTREESPAFETAATAGARLRELLASSRVLIVIDDVWSSADTTPFQGIGNGSALLITTRDSQTLPTGSERIEVDAMASAEAVPLLRSGLPDGEEREFISLAARLGEWPLLLKLVNRQLRDLVNEERQSIQSALKEVNEALDSEGFSAFDRDDPESRDAAASRTVLVSVQRLPEQERERYFQLAVFPEDVQIPLSVLERFWGLGGFQVRRFCRRLHDLSLFLDFDGGAETVRLHDVVRRVLIEQIGEQLSDFHHHLLDTFRPASGLWSDLPIEERYLWRNLAGHFLGAGRQDELRMLLMGLPFLQAKLIATDVNAVMADYQSFVEEESGLRLIRDALRLSAHILSKDYQQLASQIYGRLVGIKNKSIGKFLNFAKAELRLRFRQGSLDPAGGPLVRTLGEYYLRINALAVVDDRRVVSSSEDGSLVVWDLDTGETLRTLSADSAANALAVVSGRWALSTFDDCTLWMWDLETGETLRTFQGYSREVSALAVVDHRRAISVFSDLTLRVWDLETGETLRILKGLSSRVSAVAVVDSRRAVSGSSNGTLCVWDLETGEPLRTLRGHSSRVNAVSVVDGRRAVSGSDDRTLRVWDLETGKTIRTLSGHLSKVSAVGVVDGRRVVSGSLDGSLRVWDLEIGRTLRTLEGLTDGVSTLAVVDSHRVVSGSRDGILQVWDLETKETLRMLERHWGRVCAMRVVDGCRVISGSNDGTLQVWNLKTGENLGILGWYIGGVSALAVVDSHRVVSGSYDGMLRVLDLETGKILRTLERRLGYINALTVVNRRLVICGSSAKVLWIWDLETGETLRTLEGHTDGVQALAVMDGRRVVSGSEDKTLRVWDLETDEPLKILKGHSYGVNALAMLDSCRVVSGSADNTLRVWNIETGDTLRVLEGHSDDVNALAVVDGRRAVSGSYDRTLRMWDLETGATLAIVTLDAPIFAVAMSPDGRIVVAGDGAGKVYFLDLVEPK